MSRGETFVDAPPGSQYAVAPKRFPFGIYFFGNFDDTLNFVSVNSLALQCEVIRVAGNVLVWPIHSPGGSA